MNGTLLMALELGPSFLVLEVTMSYPMNLTCLIGCWLLKHFQVHGGF
jgi:hypothetical protein